MWSRWAWLALCAAVPASAHDFFSTKITWSAEVSRIVMKRCAGCHQAGGRAPMALTRYREARPWATAIQEVVLARRMPPWGAAKGFGEFRDDFSLTQEEMLTIADWVAGGAPEGDPKYLSAAGPDRAPQLGRSAARGLPVGDGSVIRRRLRLTALRPLDSEGRMIATLPDGTSQPLIWLIQYRREWQRAFTLRAPLELPAGTRITIQPATARFELLPATASPRAR